VQSSHFRVATGENSPASNHRTCES